jgi:hypothetical protein
MHTVRMNVFAISENDEILIARSLELRFEDNVGTFPLPKAGACEEALRMQHPRIFANIPVRVRCIMWGSTRIWERLGLRFERVVEQ